MGKTIIEQLADFSHDTRFDQLPDFVVEECKRTILDSTGCALAATDHPKGRIGIDYGRMLGGSQGEATIIGTSESSSIFGAAFANGELINALDFDAVTPPGHVSPYVLPGALAVAESLGLSGKDLIVAVAVSHEMPFRIGKAMDYVRDVKDGVATPAEVLGYSATIFGAVAAIAKLRGLSAPVTANGLGIAASTAPVNSHRAWMTNAPSSTIKYLLAGGLAQSALTASFMAELGHRGNVQILDDDEFGYRRFIGTKRWEPAGITEGLGSEWRFPAEHSYKPYPHCRILHGLLDALTEVVEENDLQPDEIEHIQAWGEGWVDQPLWTNMEFEQVHDAQFSIAHGLAVGAHRVRPSKAWQDPDLVFSRSVLDLMDRVTHEEHPDWARLIAADGASRPSRIEVTARGKTFVAERNYPKGSPSPEPETFMTTDEIADKFRINAEGVLTEATTESVVEAVLGLESVDDVSALMEQFKASSGVSV